MQRTFTFIVIINLLFSIMGVAQYVHYCCDTMSEAYFAAPSCECNERACEEEEEDGDCCKDDVKVVQLMQDGISSEKSEIAKPVLGQTLFIVKDNIIDRVSNRATIPSFLSSIDGNYSSPPIFILNRLLLI